MSSNIHLCVPPASVDHDTFFIYKYNGTPSTKSVQYYFVLCLSFFTVNIKNDFQQEKKGKFMYYLYLNFNVFKRRFFG